MNATQNNTVSTSDIRKRLQDPERLNNINMMKNNDVFINEKPSEQDISFYQSLFSVVREESKCNNDLNLNQGKQFLGDSYDLIRENIIKAELVYGEKPSRRTKNNASKGRQAKKGSKADQAGKINKSDPKAKKMTSAQRLIEQNKARTLGKELNPVLKSIESEPCIPPESFMSSSKFIELIYVRMMAQFKYYIEKHEEIEHEISGIVRCKRYDQDEVDELKEELAKIQTELIELIIAMNKICDEKSLNPLMSKTCLSDMKKWIDHAMKVINFDANKVIIETPHLTFKTRYDFLLDAKKISMLPTQADLLEFVQTNDKFLAIMRTMLNSGKTTTLIPICGWLASQTQSNKQKLVFFGPDVVNAEVKRIASCLGISFAYVKRKGLADYIDKSSCCSCNPESYDKRMCIECDPSKLVYEWSPFVDKTNRFGSCILLICDMITARILLQERLEKKKEYDEYIANNAIDPVAFPLSKTSTPVVPDYILMGDEVTKDADNQKGFMVNSSFSLSTETFVEIMKIAPEKTILMSATLPPYEDMKEFYDKIASNHEGTVIKTFSSTSARIGCGLVSANGEMFMPHSGCKTVGEIERLLRIIPSNPMIGRMYTFAGLLNMRDKFVKLELDVPDLAFMFNEPRKATQDNVQKTAYQMLQTLIESGSDNIVESVCTIDKNVGFKIDTSKMMTRDVSQFSNQVLCFSSDPVSTAINTFRENFGGIVKLDTILSDINSRTNKWEKEFAKLNSSSGKSGLTRLEHSRAVDELVRNKPSWAFPTCMQIGTREFCSKYKCGIDQGYNGSIGMNDLPNKSTVNIDLLSMLASGVGVYSRNSKDLDDAYLTCVLSLAKAGRLRFIFADESIAYGTNLAVSDIVMFDEDIKSTTGETISSIVETCSINSILQMFGRAGRGGKLSCQATVYSVSDNNRLIDLIKSYISGTLNEGTKDETKNIMTAFNTLWNYEEEVLEEPVVNVDQNQFDDQEDHWDVYTEEW